MNLQEIKDTVKDRADLAAIIGRHTKLIKEGRGFKANCPLPGHKERTPSFHINTQKNFFYCYGCSRGGDVFTFLQLVEGIPFMEALRELAGQMNLELPKQSGDARENEAQATEREAGFELLERSAKFFQRVLKDGPTPGSREAQSYLEDRGISAEEIEELRLGFAPENGDSLLKKIPSADAPVAQKLGLVQSYDGGRKVDFYRARLMIPITDVRSRVIGFSGRLLDPEAKVQKYKNSSESEWFKKKTVVYGLDRASKFIRNEGYVCVVEGFFDQWAFHRCEIPAVAVMGTALTPEHLTLIGRYTKQVILVMDTDAAGIAATKKSLPALTGADWDVRVFAGFQGKDPDEWLRENATKVDEVRAKLRAAPDGLEWFAKQLMSEAQEQKLNRMQIFQRVKEAWALARHQAQKNLLADELAPMLGLSRDEVKESLDDLLRAGARAGTRNNSTGMSEGGAPAFTDQSDRVGGAVNARPTANVSARERTAEEAFVWWMWHWDALSPNNESDWHRRLDLFSGTTAEPVVAWLSEEWLVQGKIPAAEDLAQWLSRDGIDEHLRRWILKGLVPPAATGNDDPTKVSNSFTELSEMLFRERVHGEIAKLQNQLRAVSGSESETAQLLQRVQQLRLSLERRK